MPQKEASYYNILNDNFVQCVLCPRKCKIADGKGGFCRIRINRGGKLYLATYNEVSAFALDPIEKKPLYHFYPSASILSVGTHGCNLDCKFCQNYNLSRKTPETQEVTPELLVKKAIEHKSIGIAYTYNEPLIWFEFIRDCAKIFRQNDLKNVLVSNGMINQEPLEELCKFIDGANIDLKGFTNDFYDWVGGHLEPVKNTIKTLYENGVHVEVTNLVVTGKNDDIAVFEEMCIWLASVSPMMPLHISRYFPRYKYDADATPESTLYEFYQTAKKHLRYVYVGNIITDKIPDNTYCFECGELLIKRTGYRTLNEMGSEKCPNCGTSHYLRLS